MLQVFQTKTDNLETLQHNTDHGYHYEIEGQYETAKADSLHKWKHHD